MVYVDRQYCGPPHVEHELLPSGIDLTTNYAPQLTAAPNGGQFQAIQQQIAREHVVAFSQSEYDWTLAAPVQIFFVLVAVLAVPCFIWRLLMRLGWLEERTLWAGASSPASGQHEILFPFGAVRGKTRSAVRHRTPLYAILRNQRRQAPRIYTGTFFIMEGGTERGHEPPRPDT
jgi:hypothetical protein